MKYSIRFVRHTFISVEADDAETAAKIAAEKFMRDEGTEGMVLKAYIGKYEDGDEHDDDAIDYYSSNIFVDDEVYHVNCLVCDVVWEETTGSVAKVCPSCGNDDMEQTIYLTGEEQWINLK
jgi:rubrerythrin